MNILDALHGVLCIAIDSLAPRLVGRKLSDWKKDMSTTQRKFRSRQIRFMPPERGVLKLVACAVLNAVWVLWAKSEGKPLWRLVADLPPEQFIKCIEFRYLTDALTPEEALKMLEHQAQTKQGRIKLAFESKAVPAYITSVGWLGMSDDEVKRRLTGATKLGFKHFKLKAGLDIVETDRKRLDMVPEVAGPDAILMFNVYQIWDVDEVSEFTYVLNHLNLWFIEEQRYVSCHALP